MPTASLCCGGEPLRNEMVSILTAISLVARLSRKNIEDMSLLICLELKIWNQWAMEEQMCVYTCICVCVCMCVYTFMYNYRKQVASQIAQWERTCLQCRRYQRYRFNSRVGKIPWRRAWQPNSSLLARKIPWTEEPGVLHS